MNKSFHLILDEHKPIVEQMSQLVPVLSDGNLKEFRTYVDSFFYPLPKADPYQIIEVNAFCKLYIYTPGNQSPKIKIPLLYHTHGGGFVSAKASQFSKKNQDWANEFGVIVASVEYRLAPESPYPAALVDCFEGIKYLYEHADELLIDKERISIIGESAGGGMAATLAIYVRDKKPELKIKNQFLFSPMLDYQNTRDFGPKKNEYLGEYGWTFESNSYGWSAYKGNQTISDDELGYFSAAHARDFTNLPCTYILIGGLDLFFEESLEYTRQLNRAGVPVSLEVVAGGVHGFEDFPTPVGLSLKQNSVNCMKELL
ncbi:alpha/beta hydrolase [Sphingobacterium paludis]|uniref:Acetyl esterase/lipase n=1 Tax=Sphingobacterium paludis TaxID=1476465 RepID=A0A4R7D6F7_9SPHI|nr:alpha/beta hydrolase [Sphingobacterium paludis]TDS16157.1 acetyl esterase/lipase [Sphingobacterium paludis]